MVILYNFLQFAALMLLFPVILPVVLLVKKYRGRVLGRLGFGLRRMLPEECAGRQRIWVHALSVGEVRSCRPLLAALRKEFPQCCLLLSTTTATGGETAKTFEQLVDAVIPFPFDLPFCVAYFVRLVHPDFFVLVETDFWPNFLLLLKRRGVPAFLVNGRISEKSSSAFIHYRRFFLPVFSSFCRLYMQTAGQAEAMLRLGVEKKKVSCLGNLKYDAALEQVRAAAGKTSEKPVQKGEGPLLVAGSTHAGEEEIIFRFFVRLRHAFPDAVLVVAPRDIGRAGQLERLAIDCGLAPKRRSERPSSGSYTVLILDSFGELLSCYRESDMVFIGGSLVREGGHNPLEAAVFAKPVLFGPHMDDFNEISGDLLQEGGAVEVGGEDDLLRVATSLLKDEELLNKTGRAAGRTADARRGAALVLASDMRKVLAAGDGNANDPACGESDG